MLSTLLLLIDEALDFIKLKLLKSHLFLLFKNQNTDHFFPNLHI